MNKFKLAQFRSTIECHDQQLHHMRRERYSMPDFLLEALRKANLFDAYNARPPYQKNDYIGWIIRAKRETTQQKRLHQMLDELKLGNVYMKMKWNRNYNN